MSKVYILSTDGTVKTNTNTNTNTNPNQPTEIKYPDILKEILPLSLDSDDKFSNLEFNRGLLYEKDPSFSSAFKYKDHESKVIGTSDLLLHPAFGFGEGTTTESKSYYKPYNSVFDLNLNDIQSKNQKQLKLQIFADEMQLNFIGAPLIFTEFDTLNGEIDDIFLSLADIFIAATVPITTIGLLQLLLQGLINNNSSDPVNFMPAIDPSFVKADIMGKYIGYFKFDVDSSSYFMKLLSLLNPVIDAAASFLNLIERLMGFPKFKINGILDGALQILKNILNFILGYIYYLSPGFKLSSLDFVPSFEGIITLLATFVTDLLSNVSRINSSQHNLNLLNRKIITNKYFHEKIAVKAKTTTDMDGSGYDYFGKNLITYSQFFYKFISERVAVGNHLTSTIYIQQSNKRKAFGINKIKEIPRDASIANDNSTLIPIPFGSVLGQKDKKDKDNRKSIYSSLNKSIYSFGTTIKSEYPNSNAIFEYHNKLVEQNEKLAGYFENPSKGPKDTKYKRYKRLDKEFVKEVEAIIDSDYMPFSIQDLRTNEVFKFHAFLENFGDTFTVNWDDTGAGFGRMDPIKIYKGTTRSITVDFWLVAMGPQDFDTVWWMINRLIAMIYPQWSKPITADITNQKEAGLEERGIKFSQPFTQIPTASPVIRLRLGDLFTSNYSKNTLAKIFGFEDDLSVIGNNLSDKTLTIQNIVDTVTKVISKEIQKTEAGFEIENFTVDIKSIQLESENFFNDIINSYFFERKNYILSEGGNYIDKTKFVTLPASTAINSIQTNDKLYKGLLFVDDPKNENNLYYDASPKRHNKIQPDDNYTGEYFLRYVFIVLDAIAADGTNEEEKKLVIPVVINFKFKKGKVLNMHATDGFNSAVIHELFNLRDGASFAIRNMENFMKSTSDGKINNPVVKAFESTMGEGLAGTIQNFSISYDQTIPWDIDKGRRAPMGAKISLGMSVIHDILPGLDHNGVMRAPTYRVGRTNESLFGNTVHDEKIRILPGEQNEVNKK